MLKKGFTLIEILAVIVVLGTIMLIVIPRIIGIYDEAKIKAFEVDVNSLIDVIQNKMIDNPSLTPSSFNLAYLQSNMGVKTDNYQSVSTYNYNEKIYLIVVGQNDYKNLTAYGTYDDVSVALTSSATPIYFDPSGANAPELSSAMIPITHNGTSWVKANLNSSWYNYANKQWANAVLVSQATLATYQAAAVGTTINEADVMAYLVWIPRYAYKIGSGYHTSTASTIGIKFLSYNTNMTYDGTTVVSYSNGNSASNYVLHPAFNFGGTPVTGMWVSKFEASNNGASKIKVVPNVSAWTSLTIGQMYTYSRSMETDSTYGWGTSGTGIDSHFIKNTEWGAVAYLSQSAYGKNGEIWINNVNSDTGTGYAAAVTGCAGSSVSAAMVRSATCPSGNQYHTSTGVNASTTGNITGIYDMSGGSWEYVMGNYDYLGASSGLIPTSIDNKYIDRYSSVINFGYNNTYYGDAYFETSSDAFINNSIGGTQSSWYADFSYSTAVPYPWFHHGGYYDSTTSAGVFAFARDSGQAFNTVSFRPVILVGAGL